MLYPSPNFYSLLEIPRDASPKDIKTAYHRTLLRLHPDKQTQARHLPPHSSDVGANATMDSDAPEASVDVALLQEAYRTLSDARSRAAYDGSLKREEHAQPCGPRPAQVISLEEFITIRAGGESGMGIKEEDADEAQEWRHECRCGGMYRITQDDLESGTHLVGCENCSEVIWVGYEEAPVTEEGE